MELVKVKFKGGWALAEFRDVSNGVYELYVEPVAEEIPEVKEVEDEPLAEVNKDVPSDGGRKRKK